MPIRTNDSLTGFIAAEPRLTTTENGDARLWARIGQEQWRMNPSGIFTQTGIEFTDLVAYRKTAERAYQRFAKGDRFIAEVSRRVYEGVDEHGHTIPREEYVVHKIGHDTARTNYTVTRRTTPTAEAPSAQAVGGASPAASVSEQQPGFYRHSAAASSPVPFPTSPVLGL